MACHARLAPRGTRVLAGQPEPKLGLIPGYGGTQRLPRWVGVEKAWPLLRTGESISSAQALELGLIRAEVEGDLLEAAIDLARKAADGQETLPPIPRGRIKVPKELPTVDLGHLSRKIDEILQEAVLGGARRSLEEGLELESRLFGRCFTTRDARLGLENFLQNGPRAQAQFVHE
jgi:enoyl-CoA hydratase/carnithine racemase